jgi:N-acetylmuramic acid 6-phosphate etherase
MVLNTLTVACMIRLGKVYGNLMVDLQTRSAKLHARARRIVGTLADVDEGAAARALEAAGGRAKTAVVMLRCGVDAAEAARRLAAAGGLLRKVIG